MSYRSEPSNVAQIIELHKFKKIIEAIHVFNSLVLDNNTKWYSEPLTVAYWSTREEYDAYMTKINHNAMDFSTIRRRICKNKYLKSSDLYHHMELVFKNAIYFTLPLKKNNASDSNAIWYQEAERLSMILQDLKEKKPITKQWKPSMVSVRTNVRTCPQCHNIMIPQKTITSQRCAECKTNITGQIMDCYCCNNHTDQRHNFCSKCVVKYCYKCGNWHVGQRCNQRSKPLITDRTQISDDRSIPSNDNENASTNNKPSAIDIDNIHKQNKKRTHADLDDEKDYDPNTYSHNRMQAQTFMSSQRLLLPSPPPPDILMDKMDAMSDADSIVDASPFLTPTEIFVNDTFVFDGGIYSNNRNATKDTIQNNNKRKMKDSDEDAPGPPKKKSKVKKND